MIPAISGAVGPLGASEWSVGGVGSLKVVVGAMPSSVVWPGIVHTQGDAPSTFTLAGQPLPYLPYGGPFTTVYGLYAKGLLSLDQHKDAIIPVEHAYSAHKARPDSRLEVLPGVGHFAQVEAPTEVADLIDDFISTTVGPEPHIARQGS